MANDEPAPGRRILIVEDEALVAMLLEDMLAELGFEVVETAARLDDALRAAETGTFDAAILDVNLNGGRSYAVAEVLKRRNVPVIFATGYGSSGLEPVFAGVATLQKPFQRTDLEAALSRALAAQS